MKAGSWFEVSVPNRAGLRWKIESGIQDEFGFCTEQKAGYICAFLLAQSPKTMCIRLDSGTGILPETPGGHQQPYTHRPFHGTLAPKLVAAGHPWTTHASRSRFSPPLPSRHREPHVVRMSLLSLHTMCRDADGDRKPCERSGSY